MVFPRPVLGERREGRLAGEEWPGEGEERVTCAALLTPPGYLRPSHHRGLLDRGSRCVACHQFVVAAVAAAAPRLGHGSESKVAPRDGVGVPGLGT